MVRLISVLFFGMLAPQLFASNQVPVSWSGDAPVVIDYELQDTLAITEGDIIIATREELSKPGAVVINRKSARWPDGILPFVLDSSLSSGARAAVYFAMVHYQKLTSIRFVERTEQNQQQYPDYVRFTSGSGCSSYVGVQGGEQPIVLNIACGYGATVHEIGHALGFWHEQNRLDRDGFVTIHLENVSDGHQHNFKQYRSYSMDIGDYDYDSIMHYSAYAFSKNGKKTITVLDGKHSIGQRSGLSEGDRAALAVMYPSE